MKLSTFSDELLSHLENIRNLKDHNGDSFPAEFLTNESASQIVCKKPISFEMISRKITVEKYKSYKKFTKDLLLLVSNFKKDFPKHASLIQNYLNSFILPTKQIEDVKKEGRFKVEYYEFFQIDQTVHEIKDFVYFGKQKQIFRIHKIFSQDGNKIYILGSRYFRSKEVPRSLLKYEDEQELFYSFQLTNLEISEITGKCIVIGDCESCFDSNVYFCERFYDSSNYEIYNIEINDEIVSEPISSFKNNYPLRQGCQASCSNCNKNFAKFQQLIDHFEEHLPQNVYIDCSSEYPIKTSNLIKNATLEFPKQIVEGVLNLSGNIVWFESPPLNIKKGPRLQLSEKYIEFKNRKNRNNKG